MGSNPIVSAILKRKQSFRDDLEKRDIQDVPGPDLNHLFNRALSAHRAGQLDIAAALYREVLSHSKKQFSPLHLLGVIEGQRGNLAEGIRQITKALRLDPKSPEAYLNLGRMQGELGDLENAEKNLRKSIALNPGNPLAHSNLAAVYRRMKHYDRAKAAADQAIKLNPNEWLALINRGNALSALSFIDEAKADYERAGTLQPSTAEPWIGLGYIAHKNRDAKAAADYAKKALSLAPGSAEAHLLQAKLLRTQGLYEEAMIAASQALVISPDYADAQVLQSSVLVEMKRYQEAIPLLEDILRTNPEMETAKGQLFVARMMICDWDRYEKERAECVRAINKNPFQIIPYDSIIVTQDPAQHLACAIAQTKANIPEVKPIGCGEPSAHNRIRVGYVSPDFRDHAVGRIIAGLFSHHDRTRFEVYGFSTAADQSPLRKRIESACDHFIEIAQMNDRDAAQCIRENEIDVLVDLAGHTRYTGLNAMAFRPSPVQVTWLGFPGTTGTSFMDYIIADPTVLPIEHERFYTEKAVRLPDTYQPNDDALIVAEVPSREAAGLPANGLVFCCFNNTFKITPEVFSIWMRLLGQVERSVLWLFEGNAAAKANLQKEAAARGISPDRLVFAPHADYATYLARTQLADLFLDNNYWNGHSTASDALRCGVPVITCQGQSFASRVAASLLRAIGMPELIARSLEEYEALALKLARDPALLATTKEKLARNRLTMPLFDTERFTRHLEAAYWTMHERAQRGELPASFSVDAT